MRRSGQGASRDGVRWARGRGVLGLQHLSELKWARNHEIIGGGGSTKYRYISVGVDQQTNKQQ